MRVSTSFRVSDNPVLTNHSGLWCSQPDGPFFWQNGSTKRARHACGAAEAGGAIHMNRGCPLHVPALLLALHPRTLSWARCHGKGNIFSRDTVYLVSKPGEDN